MSGITLVIADALPVVLIGLRTVLDSQADLTVLAETNDGADVVKLAESYRPDILVLDQDLPNLSLVQAARLLGRRFPKTKVVLLSHANLDGRLLSEFGRSVEAIVSKNNCTAEILHAIRDVVDGKQYISPSILDAHGFAYSNDQLEAASPANIVLTSREKEVLLLAIEGNTSAQIAERLGISVRTAETHRSNMMHKIGVKKHSELVRFAVRHGLLALER